MSFKIQTTDFDLGVTSIENIFINDFMPMADGTAVKVYLLAFKNCNDESKKTFDNKSLAKHLNIPLDDVHRSWSFWLTKGIVKKIESDNDENSYDIEFLSLRQLVAKGIYSTKSRVIESKNNTGNNLDLIQANKNPEIRKMFYSIDQTMRRQLVPNERNTVLDWIYKQNINIDIITRAFKYCVDERGVKHINYVSSVVRGWHDSGILTLEDLEEHFAKSNSHYSSYKTIYRTLGYANKLPSAGDKEIIDIWLDEYKLDLEYVVKLLTEVSKRTSNINMNYANKAIANLVKEGITSTAKYEDYLKQKNENKSPKATAAKQNNKTNKNKFHNFKSSDKKYTNEELEKKLGLRK